MIRVATRIPVLGDRWLLCSDGVSDYLPDDVIAQQLIAGAERHGEEVAAELVALALDAGSRDNITAVVCDVVDGVPGYEEPWWAGAAADRFAEDFAALTG